MLLTNEKEITEKVFDKYGNKSSVELREKCIDDLSKINVKDIGDEITPENMYNIFANH